MPRDPEKRREQNRLAQQRFRDRRRNPGPGRPRKDGKGRAEGQRAVTPRSGPPVTIESPDFDAIAVLTVERQRKILTWVAEHPETRPGDRTRAINTLADLERKDGKVDAAENTIDPRLVAMWSRPECRAMLEDLLAVSA